MIYKHKNFGESKYYAISTDFWGHTEVVEYVNGCPKTRLGMTEDQASNFLTMLEKNGWNSTLH
jgi:hypothetical protein